MSKVSYTENYHLTQYSEVDEPVFLNDITRDNALIDEALTDSKETAENAVSVANTAKDTADYAKSVADGVASDLQVTNQNVTDLTARVAQNEADIALLQPAKITALENKIDSNTNLINAVSNELDSVEAEVESHGNRLDALESASAQLRTDVDTLRGEFDECCAEVNTHLSEIDEEQDVQDNRLGSLETRMDSAETRLDNLETEDITITGQLEILTARVNQLLSDLDPTNVQSALALTQQVIANTNDILSLIADVSALEEQAGNETLITTAQTLSGAINELANATVVIDSQLDANSTHAVQNSTLTGIIGTDTLSTVAQTITGAINELMSSLTGVDSREATHYSNVSSAISSLDSRVGSLETAVGDNSSGLTKQVNDIDADLTTVSGKVGDLETAVGDNSSGLVKDMADAQSDISSLQSTVGDSTSGLVKDMTDAQADISALESTVGDNSSGLVKDVANLTTDLSTLEATVGDANSGLVKKVATLETTVGDNTAGLVKDVADNASAITALQSDVSALETTVGDNTSGLVKDMADAQSDISALETTVGDSSAGLVKDVNDLKNRDKYVIGQEEVIGEFAGKTLYRRTIKGVLANASNADRTLTYNIVTGITATAYEQYISTANWNTNGHVYLTHVYGVARHHNNSMIGTSDGQIPIPILFNQSQFVQLWHPTVTNTSVYNDCIALRNYGYTDCEFVITAEYTKEDVIKP